ASADVKVQQGLLADIGLLGDVRLEIVGSHLRIGKVLIFCETDSASAYGQVELQEPLDEGARRGRHHGSKEGRQRPGVVAHVEIAYPLDLIVCQRQVGAVVKREKNRIEVGDP